MLLRDIQKLLPNRTTISNISLQTYNGENYEVSALKNIPNDLLDSELDIFKYLFINDINHNKFELFPVELDDGSVTYRFRNISSLKGLL